MDRETLAAVVEWQGTRFAEAAVDGCQGDDREATGGRRSLRRDLEITFHGGEPLLVGAAWYRSALPMLREGLGPRFAVQSNLWLLDDELCDLFAEYEVALGTSLDGPERVTDAQRGAGYFARTMAGVERARAHGLQVGCICTFSPQSASRVDEVCGFFAAEGLSFAAHAALPSLRGAADGWALSPAAHGELLVGLLERYLADPARLRIGTLDAMARGVSAGRAGLCTFGDCLGEYLAVGPDGAIYPCQRLAGLAEYRLGQVVVRPDLAALRATSVWRTFRAREEGVATDCGDCAHLAYCRGGCPYNVLAAGGDLAAARRDPQCPAYRRAFDAIVERALAEVFSEENLGAVVGRPDEGRGLLRRGRLLTIMGAGPHPHKVAARAREVVAAVALAVSDSPEEALGRLDCAGLVTSPATALASLRALRRRLDAQSQSQRLNAYLHITYTCNLRCSHCYARAEPARSEAMAASDMARLVRELAAAGFRKAVVTGGEPFAHPEPERLLDELAALRAEVKPLQTVLRTNLASTLTPLHIGRLLGSVDQVVVSVDGDEGSHDARRGTGTYARTLANLRALVGRAAELRGAAGGMPAEVAITAVLDGDQIGGGEGRAVRALGKELHVPIRFKPRLPLGRAADEMPKLGFPSFSDDAESFACGTHVAATCGLGMNVSIDPAGECFPCYALAGDARRLGNALTQGLDIVLARNDTYRDMGVDTDLRCRRCAVRYICGGLCRAWVMPDAADGAPTGCAAVHRRAQRALRTALHTLRVSPDRWLKAGLPDAADADHSKHELLRGRRDR